MSAPATTHQFDVHSVSTAQRHERGDDPPAIRAVDDLHDVALAAAASDVHLEPCEGGGRIRQRVDGILIETRRVPATLFAQMVSRIKVNDSQTIVLGGLMRDVDNQTVERIPWLSQVPVLGKFFENKSTHHERDEIVFLITPHVIKPDQAPPQH